MSETTKEFLHSLHPVFPDELVVQQVTGVRMDRIPCCYILRPPGEDSQVIKLNDTGALIWSLCEQQRSVGEISDLIADAYSVDREEVRRDISRVMDHLFEENVLLSTESRDLSGG